MTNVGRSNLQRVHTLVSQLMLQIKLPGRMLIVAPQAGFRELARYIKSHPDAQVFPS